MLGLVDVAIFPDRKPEPLLSKVNEDEYIF